MGFSLILRAFFSFPNERQFIECQFFWKFRKSIDRRECTINYQIRGYDFGNLQIHTVKPLDIERYVSQLLREKR